MASTKSELLSEYIKKIKFAYLPLLKFGAFNRIDIKDGRIVGISRLSQKYSFVVMLTVDILGYLIFFWTTENNTPLIFPELMSIISYMFLNNSTLLSIHLVDRHAGALFFRKFIEIDTFLGIKETKFMRDITDKYLLIWFGLIGSFQIYVMVVLVITFQLPVTYNIIVAIYFMLVCCVIYDHLFHMGYYNFLCLRVHYLNVALVKIANLDDEYLTNQLLSYPIFWKKEYNQSVDFHSRAGTCEKHFTDNFRMLFDQMQRISKAHQFLMFNAVVSLIITTFLAIQAIICFIKDPEMTMIRTLPIGGWAIVHWFLLSTITHQMVQFKHQTECTKLICTYIQLSPDNSDDILHLSRRILDVLSSSDCRHSIFGLFFFDGRLLRSIATSVFVYVTMQFQIAFPTNNKQNEETTHT